jgi:hypothetical protein
MPNPQRNPEIPLQVLSSIIQSLMVRVIKNPVKRSQVMRLVCRNPVKRIALIVDEHISVKFEIEQRKQNGALFFSGKFSV